MALPSLLALTDRVLTRAAARIDDGVLQNLERRMRSSAPRRLDDVRARLIEVAAAYGGATTEAFFGEPEPAEVTETKIGPGPEGAQIFDLAFPSSYRPFHAPYLDEHHGHRENLTVHARRYTIRGAPRPTVVCIHGLGGGTWWLEERAFAASYWLHHGYDVVLFQLPFHGRRLPAGRGRGTMFPSPNVVRTNEAFGQAVHDLRALRAWLEARGSLVGGIGMSLGGYTLSLWASVDERLAFAVPWIPAVDMADLMWRHGEDSPARRRAIAAGVSADLLREVFAVHMPTTRAPKIPHAARMIVAGRGDRITPPDQAERLWHHWERCAIHWFPGGHLAQVGRADALRAARRHLDQLGLTKR
jgi:pimeloyl-ACP methyl ester carboxylesterase